MSDDYFDDDIDDDIDVDYDWNASKADNLVDDDIDDIDDNDIDCDYDWNSSTVNVKKVPDKPPNIKLQVTAASTDFKFPDDLSPYSGSFDMDSPKFLDTPLYSNTPVNNNNKSLFKIISLNTINTSINPSISNDDFDPDSPISVLTPNPSVTVKDNDILIPFDIGLSNMDVIIEKEKDKQINVIKQIDDIIGEYYKYFKLQNDYFNHLKGKFMIHCENNNISDNDVKTYLNSEEPSDYEYLNFDKNFPLKLSNSILDNNDIDNETQSQMKLIEIYTIIKYCFKNGKSPL